MGYTRFRKISDLAQDEPFQNAASAAARRWTDFVRRRAAELSPVAVAPEGVSATQFSGGRGRAPGTLRDSWEADAPTQMGARKVVAGVFTRDEIAVYMEYGTRAHWIRPRADRAAASVLASGKPRATGDSARLRFRVGGRIVYARQVFHPGTQPYLMLHRALEDSRGVLRSFLAEELRREFVDYERRIAA